MPRGGSFPLTESLFFPPFQEGEGQLCVLLLVDKVLPPPYLPITILKGSLSQSWVNRSNFRR